MMKSNLRFHKWCWNLLHGMKIIIKLGAFTLAVIKARCSSKHNNITYIRV